MSAILINKIVAGHGAIPNVIRRYRGPGAGIGNRSARLVGKRDEEITALVCSSADDVLCPFTLDECSYGAKRRLRGLRHSVCHFTLEKIETCPRH